jgi:hypothetical protein
MKPITRQQLALWMIAACSVVIAATITAPPASGNETIIGGQVHSDVVIGTPQPGISTTESESYVGDIPAEQANACSTDDCGPEGACRGAGSGGRLGLRSRVSDYASGQMIDRAYGRPDLFYNFFTQGYYNRANAQMYLSPLPIPPNVGHTFYTYQPFYPHHMLYTHKNRFHRTYDHGRGMNRTHVSYRPSVRQVVCDLYWNTLRLPR